MAEIKYLDLVGLQEFWKNAKAAIAQMDAAAVNLAKDHTNSEIAKVKELINTGETNTAELAERVTAAEGTIATHTADINANKEAITAEVARAEKAEKALSDLLGTMESTEMDDNVIGMLKKEVARAKAAEETLTDSLNTANGKITANTDAIAAEVKRSTEFDNAVRAELGNKGSEAAQPETIYGRLKKAEDAVTKEIQDRTQADTNISNLLGTINDAKEAQTAFGKIAAEAFRADAAEKVNAQAVVDEADRATKAEQANKSAIDQEVLDRKAADEAIRKDLGTNTDPKNSAFERIATLEGSITGLSGAMHFIGITSTDPSAGTVTIDGKVISSFKPGDVVIYQYINEEKDPHVTCTEEFVYCAVIGKEGAGYWTKFGDEGSLATTDFVNTQITEKVNAEADRAKGEEAAIRREFVAADNTLKSDIEADYQAADNTEKSRAEREEAAIRSEFAKADAAINATIGAKSDVAEVDTVFGRIATEKRDRIAAVQGVDDKVTAEASTRESADTTLGQRIDAVEGKAANTRISEAEILALFAEKSQANA